jgi:hypothetical protein
LTLAAVLMIVGLSSGGDHGLIFAEGTGRLGGDALVEREQDVLARQEHGPGRDDRTRTGRVLRR